MRKARNEDRCLAILCDANGATLLAAARGTQGWQLVGRRVIALDTDQPPADGRLAELNEFVAQHQLRGRSAYIALAGPGTVVQLLRLPPLRAALRAAAIRTRLQSAAGAATLVVAHQPVGQQERGAPSLLLTAGADPALVRLLMAACRRADVRVRGVSALAGLLSDPQAAPTCVQLWIEERTTTIQVLRAGLPVACRDVLIGRRDFLAAYQRPILSDAGPLTFTPQQAEQALCEVGVPVGREAERVAGVSAGQLWPVLSPVLQRLRNEILQTLPPSDALAETVSLVRAFAAPEIPGLAESVANELSSDGGAGAASATASFDELIEALRRSAAPAALDLRPLEERFVTKMRRPALIAAGVSAFIMLANASRPQAAHARLGELRDVADTLAVQRTSATAELTEVRTQYGRLQAELSRDAHLRKCRPPAYPWLAAIKDLLSAVPDGAALQDLQFSETRSARAVTLRGRYIGQRPASDVAAEWVRKLHEAPLTARAQLTQVTGDGQEKPALIEISIGLR